MNIIHLPVGNDKGWDEYIDKHPQGTPFHKCQWLYTIREVLHKPVYLLASVTEQGQINGVLPLTYCRTIRDKALISVPFRDHGSTLADNSAIKRDLIRSAKELALDLKASRITFQRVETPDREWLVSEGFHSQLRGIDTELDLSLSEEVYWHSLKSPVRRAVKKARKSGITVIVDEESAYLPEYFDLFVQTRQRLGVTIYPQHFFQSLSNCNPQGVKLLVAKLQDSTIVGGLIIFLHGFHAYSGYLGYRAEYLNLRIVDILFYEAFCLARNAGVKTFLMGTDSPTQESLIRYKKKWLAKPKEVYAWHWTSSGKLYNWLDTETKQFDWIRVILRKLPRSLFLIASRLSLHFWE